MESQVSVDSGRVWEHGQSRMVGGVGERWSGTFGPGSEDLLRRWLPFLWRTLRSLGSPFIILSMLYEAETCGV